MGSNVVILYTAPLGQRKRNICIVPDLPESLLPELGPKDPNRDRGSSETVGESKETICLYVWGFEIKAFLQILAPDASEGTGGWWVVIFLFLPFDTS